MSRADEMKEQAEGGIRRGRWNEVGDPTESSSTVRQDALRRGDTVPRHYEWVM